MVSAATLGVNRSSMSLLSTSTCGRVNTRHRSARDADVDDARPRRKLPEDPPRDGDLERDVGGSAEHELEAGSEMEDELPVLERRRGNARAEQAGCRENARESTALPGREHLPHTHFRLRAEPDPRQRRSLR